MLVRSISYDQSPGAKHLAWMLHAGMLYDENVHIDNKKIYIHWPRKILCLIFYIYIYHLFIFLVRSGMFARKRFNVELPN